LLPERKGDDEEKKDSAPAFLPAEVLTASASRAWAEVAYELDGGSDDGEGEESEGLDDADGAPDNSEGGIAARKKALRTAAAETAGADRARAKQGQDALLERINQITLEALTSKGGGEKKSFFLFEFFFFGEEEKTFSFLFFFFPLLSHSLFLYSLSLPLYPLSPTTRRLRRQDGPQALQRVRLQVPLRRPCPLGRARQRRRPRRVAAAADLRGDASLAHPDGEDREPHERR
jgi:hypothetical protein